MCVDTLPCDIAVRVVDRFKNGSNDEYHEALEELRHSCSFDDDEFKLCLREAGMPAAMLKRARRRLIRGDTRGASELFDKAQKFFGTSYIVRLDAKFGLSERLENEALVASR